MTHLPLALSLSSTLTKIGAVAAFVALVGIALLSLLVFSQARELKRLREWAGRAPERAADLEQRVTAAAAMRVQQRTPGVQPVRPVARPALNQPPPGGAAPTVANPAAPPAPGAQPAPGAVPLPAPSPTTVAGPPAPGTPNTGPSAPGPPVPVPVPAQAAPAVAAQSQPGQVASGQTAGPDQGSPSIQAGFPVRQTPPVQLQSPAPRAPGQGVAPARPQGAPPPLGRPASAAGVAQAVAAPAPGAQPQTAQQGAPATSVAPATAAAAAASAAGGAAARAPSPPYPPAPGSPPRRPAAPASTVGGGDPRSAPRPAPGAQPERAAAAASTGRATRVVRPGTRGAAELPIQPARSRARMFTLIAGAVIVVAAAVVALTSLGGSSTKDNASTPSTTSVSQTSAHHTSTHSKAPSKPTPKAPAVSPAETSVAVLNGTETTGLAHHISADLQQSGYSQAQPLNGRPPGSGQVTVVQYASGHQAEAEGVAHSLEVSRVQPLESAVASLAGSANVVVIVGADKAATVP